MPWLGDEEIKNLKATIDRSWLTEGPECTKALDTLKNFLGCKYVTFAPNGTLGLFLSLLALDLPSDSEVLVPDFTFFASCSSIAMAGLKPVVVDVDKNTFQIDINDLRRKITSKTRLIMPVHIYGQGCQIIEIMNIAKEFDLKVIEDACQALGVKYNDCKLQGSRKENQGLTKKKQVSRNIW